MTLSPFTVFFLGGIIAEACCCVVFVPVDVIKERLEYDYDNPFSDCDNIGFTNP